MVNAVSGAAFAPVFLAIILIPFAIAGIALINTGLNRSRNAAHSIFTCVTISAVAMLVYFAIGFAVEGISGHPGHVFHAVGKSWAWLGDGPFFLRGFDLSASPASSSFLFQIFAVALAALIPAAGGAERWRLSASCASTALLAAWTYPLFSHWIFGGWLGQLGTSFGISHGFADPAGASSIHALGGLTALSVSWILGPRRGKFTGQGMPTAMPGHNAIIVMFGGMLALLGWFGLNTAGAFLFGHAPCDVFVLIAVNTTLSAVSGGIASSLITRLRFGRPDASLATNGWVGGLVASSATSLYVKPAEAVLIGLLAGALVIFSIEFVELRMKVDDPAGAVSVHAVGGIWGILAVGIFGRLAGDGSQLLAQLAGIATLLGFVLPLSYCLNWIMNRFYSQRVAPEGERQGLDLFELGAGAYPDFVTHRDDFIHR
jgi:Amt family ammonium transporter